MAANFENFLISPDFPINFRKVTKFQRIISKALRVMDKNLCGEVPKDLHGLNRVKPGFHMIVTIAENGCDDPDNHISWFPLDRNRIVKSRNSSRFWLSVERLMTIENKSLTEIVSDLQPERFLS